MQMHHPGSNVPHKGRHAECNAEEVDRVVAVTNGLTSATSVLATLFLSLHRAREGLRDQRALEKGWVVVSRWIAGRSGEDIDQLEDKVTGERAAKVAYAVINGQ